MSKKVEKSKELPYLIEEVEKPLISRSTDYDLIINDLKNKKAGWYRIEYKGKEPKSLYIVLLSRAKKANIKLHVIKNVLYAEVTGD